MSLRCYFIFRPKNPWKTAVNAMNWRTNEMLKSEYFAEVRGFRYNKQQAAGLYVWAISYIYIIYQQVAHPWKSHGVDYTAVSEQVVKPREPRGEPLNSAPADCRVRSQCLVSSLASDVAFSETVRCWCYSKLMLVWVVRFINFGVTMSQSQYPLWEYLFKVDVT